ncbi:MAG: cbb3-type cytochrome oxidase assembly protein [Actinobacteria bacterium]|nr:cbb3-type cytochrome oxidase assembly protein [Actinomycetota bacterium]
MRRLFRSIAIAAIAALVVPAAAFAHEAPESSQSRWVMVDWMLEAFFVFAGFALVGFIWAWKAGHFHDLEQQAAIPLGIEEPDYYTPEWAYDEEEWDE